MATTEKSLAECEDALSLAATVHLEEQKIVLATVAIRRLMEAVRHLANQVAALQAQATSTPSTVALARLDDVSRTIHKARTAPHNARTLDDTMLAVANIADIVRQLMTPVAAEPEPPEEPLKPCPFCGSDILTFNVEVPGEIYVSCGRCAAEGPVYAEPRAARDAWNTRGGEA